MVNRIIKDIDFGGEDDSEDDYEGKYNDDDILQVNEEKMSLMIGAYDVAYHMLKYARPFVEKICSFNDEILDEMQDTLDAFMYCTANKNEEDVSYWDVVKSENDQQFRSVKDKDMSIAVTKFLQLFEKVKGIDLDADKKGDSE